MPTADPVAPDGAGPMVELLPDVLAQRDKLAAELSSLKMVWGGTAGPSRQVSLFHRWPNC